MRGHFIIGLILVFLQAKISLSFRSTISQQRVHKFVSRHPTVTSDRIETLHRRKSLGAIAFPSINAVKSSPLLDALKVNKLMHSTFNGVRGYLLLLAGALTTLRLRMNYQVQSVTNGMESGWTKRGYGGGFSRTIEVWGFAISFLYKYVQVQKLKKKDAKEYSQGLSNLGKVLTNKILELGPTFIKLGQLLSTRIDVLPKEIIKELVLLQDQVPGFPGEVAVQILERELGQPIEQLFDSFNRTAIAAASLGQVHVAYKNGQKLAVKVQRQGLKELFDMDLKNIKILAILLDKFDPKSDGAQRDWASIYDESARLLYKEIDYTAEAYNSIRFKENFRDVPWVKVPDVYLNMTTSNVVTMEFVSGIKVNDIAKIEAAGINRQLLAKRSAESYLTQICRHGFFHCDPHPGNVACDAEHGGRLIYYDFGMMDELKPQVKNGLVDLIFGIYENEPKEVCDALETIEVLKPNVDRLSVEKIARVFLNEFTNGIKKGEKWVTQLPPEKQAEIRRQRRLQLGADLFSVGSDVPFKFPPTFTFVFRAFTSLDGIGKGLDANYDLTRLAQPYLKELVDLRDGSATLSLLKTWAKKLGLRPVDLFNTISQPRKIANVESVITKMEQGDLKLRVRVLESERAFKKLELENRNLALGFAAAAFLNIGVTLAKGLPIKNWSLATKGAYALAGIFGLQVPIGLIKLRALQKKFESFEK